MAQAYTETTQRQREAFLDALAHDPSVTHACKAAKIGRRTVYDLRQRDSDFAQGWEEMQGLGIGAVEDELWRRGAKGWLEPVFQGGRRVGSVRKYSDTAAIFMLKAHAPERYRETMRVDIGAATEAELEGALIVAETARRANANGASTAGDGEAGVE